MVDAPASAAARGRPPARPGAAAAGRSVELSRVAAKLWKILTLTKPIALSGTMMVRGLVAQV